MKQSPFRARLCFLIIAATLAAANPIFGQAVATVQIAGTVHDSTGAVIPAANVTATQTQKGFSRTVVTGSDGGYVITQLPVGPYELKAEKTGFKAYAQHGIELQVGDNPRIDITLEVGELQQTVEVNAAAEMVQTRQTSVSTVVDQRRMVQLPLNGRQATQLIILAGAATPSRNGGATTSKNYPSSVALSVAGGTGNSTNYLMDGADNEDAFSNVNQPFPFPDALQEFNVETSVTGASYGVRPGATVNVVTKSGANHTHGDIFEFLRNGSLNARNFFAAKHDSLKRNQFGGTIGGSIIKDKLFYFAGYQGTRNRQAPPESLAFVPNAAMLAGDFTSRESTACVSKSQFPNGRTLTDPDTGQPFTQTNQIDPTRFSAPAVALATQYFPKTSDPCGAVRFGIPTTGDEDQEIGRIDWNKSTKQTIFGRYFVTDYRNPGIFDGKNIFAAQRPGVLDRSQNFVLGDTFSFSPNFVNSLHLRFSRIRIDRGPAPNLINPTDLGVKMNALVKNFIDVSASGDFATGCGICAPGFFNDNSYQVADDIDFVRGKHQLAFGGEYFKNQLNWLANTLSNGQFVFRDQFTGDALADFLMGRVASVGKGMPLLIYLRENIVSLYVQDTWKPRSNVTVNAGLRWEPLLPEFAKDSKGAVFNHAAYSAGTMTQVFQNSPPGFFYFGDKGIPRSFAKRDLNNFAPRLGISWHPASNSATVVRASYGIFYQQPQMFYIERFSQIPPFGDLVTLLGPTGGFADPLQQIGGDPFPLPLPPPKNAFFVPAGSFISMPSDLRMPTPYTQQWNLVVQRQFGPDWLVSASYIGNSSLHIWNQTEGNPAVFLGNTTNSTVANTNQRRILYLENPSPTAGALVGTIALADPGGHANYNGLILSVNHRFSQNFSVLANWTYSHCIDEADNSGDLAFPQYQNPFDRAIERGNCTFDHRQMANTSFLYRTKSDWGNAWMGRILEDWEVSTILTSYSGDFLVARSGADNSRTGVGNDRPNVTGPSRLSNRTIAKFFDTSVFSKNAFGTFGNAGRNTILGPAFINFDVGLARRIKLAESKDLEVRSEFFNVFNHTNFNDPSTTITASTFGKLTGAADPRILQFSLKFHF